MAGVTPTAVTPPPSLPSQEPSQLGLGKDQTKPLDKDLENHLGGIQGKHKPEAKSKSKSEQPQQPQQPSSSKSNDDDSTKHSHHKHQHKHAPQPTVGQ